MNLISDFHKRWMSGPFAGIQQPVLLAVSGGADSMVMAGLFLAGKLPFAVAHCNFRLRADEADKDEQLVKEWCARNGIVFHATHFDTKQASLSWKKGIQETARILRYEWLEQLRATNNYAAIATAHHAADNVETLLINLFKGTGINGLHGIPPQNGHIIRPLLFAAKEDILMYARENNIPYRDDASNASDAYLRNAVRHHIIPAAEQWFPGVVQNVNDSITRFAQAEILYNKAVAADRKKLLEQRGRDYYIPVLKFIKAYPLETLCYELFSPFGFSPAQVPHILQLLHADTGHFVVSATHRVIRNRAFLIITDVQTGNADHILIEAAPCTVDTEGAKWSVAIRKRPEKIPADPNTLCADIARVTFPLILRKWRTGDYFYPLGMNNKKKKVSRFLIDQKVALHDKERIWILESDKRIVWVAGMRPDERFKVKDGTAQVLMIELLKH